MFHVSIEVTTFILLCLQSKCWFLVCFMSFWTTCEVLKFFFTCFKVQNKDFETHLNLEIWYSYLYVESGALCALDVLSCMCKLNFFLGNFWSSKPFLCNLQRLNVASLWTNYALDIPTTPKGATTPTYAYPKIMHTIDLTTTYCRQWPQWYVYLFKNPHGVCLCVKSQAIVNENWCSNTW